MLTGHCLIRGDTGRRISAVIGLSLPLLRRMLADMGVAITDLWRPARDERQRIGVTGLVATDVRWWP